MAMLKNQSLTQRLRLKLKNIWCIRIQSISVAKKYVEFNKEKRPEAEKKWWQRWKSAVKIDEQCCMQKNNGKLEK